jgi:hypothetical protein
LLSAYQHQRENDAEYLGYALLLSSAFAHLLPEVLSYWNVFEKCVEAVGFVCASAIVKPSLN